MEKSNLFNLKKYKSVFEYILIIALWLLIFGKNTFSNFVFLDFVQPKFIDLFKNIYLSDFHYNFYIFDLFKIPLILLGIGHLLFTLSVLISMLFSYFYIKRISKLQNLSTLFSLLFALIFFFNPFVYSRIMTGQIGVLISYFLIPVFLYYLFVFFEDNFSLTSTLKLVLAFTIASSLSMQFFALNLILLFVFAFWNYFYKTPRKELKHKSKTFIKAILIFFAFAILLNSHWIFGIFSTDSIFIVIDASHETFFAPKLSQGVPAVAKIMGMWGFWREAGYSATHRIFPLYLWYFSLFILVSLMVAGYYLNHDNKKAKFFYTIWWIGVILATGISHPYTSPIFDFLFKNLPLFNGFRDSHKFVAFIALSYAYLCPLGIIGLKNKLKSKKLDKIIFCTITFLFIAFIFIYTFPLIGLWNQLQPTQFPASYSEANNYLNVYHNNGYIIYLPWQTYLTYKWTINTSSDGRIANPINSVIEKPVLQGPDRWGNEDYLAKEISNCIKSTNIECLESKGVSFILNDKCSFYPDSYSWLNSTLKVSTTECIDIYKLSNKKTENTEIPLRFIIGIAVSLLSLFCILRLLYLKLNKK